MNRYILLTSLNFLFLFFQPQNSMATHLLGGEITWECRPSGRFVFTTKIYVACYQGAAWAPNSASVVNPLYNQYGGVSSISMTRIIQRDLSQSCYDPSKSFPCGVTIANGGSRSMQENVYVSDPVKINGVPAQSGSEFYWTSCCRPVLLNANGSNYYLRAVMFPYTPAGSSTALSLGSSTSGPTCYDSSPQFIQAPVPVACSGAFMNVSVATGDPNADSTTYHWTTPMQTSTNAITWKTGYSLTSQFPDTSFNSSNVPATLDTTNGWITFKTYPVAEGYNVYSVVVSSYRNGQKVSQVYRDWIKSWMFGIGPVVLANCTQSPAVNNKPVLDLKSAGAFAYKTVFDTAIAAGSRLELDLRAIDTDVLTASPLQFQSVDLSVGGVAMSGIANNPNACSHPPCAYLDSVGNPAYVDSIGAFIDTISVITRFVWETDCGTARLNYPFVYGPLSHTYKFIVTSKDNTCPSPAVNFISFNVTVYDSTSIPWQVEDVDASTGGAKLKWSGYPYSNFNSYNLMRYELPNSTWKKIASISNPSTTSYDDQSALTDQKQYKYQIQVNDTSVCETSSESGNILLSASIQSNTWVTLQWNNPQFGNFNSGNYTVFRKPENGIWSVVKIPPYGVESYIDQPVWQSYRTYYRVDGYDNLGLNTSSNVVVIERDTPWIGLPEIHEPVIQFIPNPFHDELTLVDANRDLAGTSLQIYTLLGEVVREYKVLAPKMTLDMSGLKAGVYFVKYRDKKGKTGVERIVKVE